MKSLSGLGIGLCLVFGCLLLALVAEVYYLIWWRKKRVASSAEIKDEYNNYAKELIQLFRWKKPTPVHSNNNNNNTDIVRDPEAINVHHEPDPELGLSKDLLLKTFGDDSVEAELMRLHNLAGPPRFLFTIKEETKEDLESEDGKSRCDRSKKGSRTRSLSDLVLAVDTPFLSPLASPPLKSTTLSSIESNYSHRGFNPLFESSVEAELNRFKSSPPPKFKFLRDAEEKLLRKLVEEVEKGTDNKNVGRVQESDVKAPQHSILAIDAREGSFLSFLVGKHNRDRDVLVHAHHHHSSSSQVLPLASSPTAFKPEDQ